MKIKTFRGHNMLQLLEIAKKELGPMTVFLSVRKIKTPNPDGGFTTYLEGAAAVDTAESPTRASGDMILDTYNLAEPIQTARAPRGRNHWTDEEYEEPKERKQLKALLETRSHSAPQEPVYGNADRFNPISSLFQRARELVGRTGKQAKSSSPALILMGPANSGKTLTAAKFAAQFRKRNNLPIGIITLDSVTQDGATTLQKYAKTLEVPFTVTRTAPELRSALLRWGNRGPIIIDTPRVAPHESIKLAKVIEVVGEFFKEVETHLVLDARENILMLARSLQGFKPSGYSKVLLTHMDQSEDGNDTLERMANANISISYLGTGQDAMEDLVVPTAKNLKHWARDEIIA